MNLIESYKGYLMSWLRMNKDYDDALGLSRKTVLVEGFTDEKFYKRVLREDTRCVNAKNIVERDQKGFRTGSGSGKVSINCKDLIVRLMEALALYSENLGFPKNAKVWPLFGIVDRDDEEDAEYAMINKLFITDTRDLETLILSTDMKVLTRLEKCHLSEEEIREALYVAEQLGAYKKAIKQEGSLSSWKINAENGTVDYSKFTKDKTVDLQMLLDFINRNNEQGEKPKKAAKLKDIKAAIVKGMKKQLDKDGNWKKTLQEFSPEESKTIWLIVNGHDVLSAVCYIKPEVDTAFSSEQKHKLNREFELAIIGEYDYECLKTTELYRSLSDADLVREAM